MDDDDEFGADAEFLEALAASVPTPLAAQNKILQASSPHVVKPAPRQATLPPSASPPQETNVQAHPDPKIVQPTPQVLTNRSSTSSILVSPRQKGNPLLTNLRSFAWEYSDITADYILGLTTCALFLSLKYHRLHPEYIYNRIKGLQGKFNLRVLLILVDISNHEDPLKELTKTSLVNKVTIILCWSAAEAARYLELYKSYEHSKDSTGIKGIEKKGYAEKLVEFITVPRGVNKTDAVSIVSAFGSIREAINARPEEITVVGGWGEKKVRRWCKVIDEPFYTMKTHQKGSKDDLESILNKVVPVGLASENEIQRTQISDSDHFSQELQQPISKLNAGRNLNLGKSWQSDPSNVIDDKDVEVAPNSAANEEKLVTDTCKKGPKNDELSSGLSAALARLRKTG